MCSLHFYRLNVKFFIVKQELLGANGHEVFASLMECTQRSFHLGTVIRHISLGCKNKQILSKGEEYYPVYVQLFTNTFRNTNMPRSECHSRNKITLKVWLNAIPIGNFYSYLQVLKATSRTCPDFVTIWSISF